MGALRNRPHLHPERVPLPRLPAYRQSRRALLLHLLAQLHLRATPRYGSCFLTPLSLAVRNFLCQCSLPPRCPCAIHSCRNTFSVPRCSPFLSLNPGISPRFVRFTWFLLLRSFSASYIVAITFAASACLPPCLCGGIA